MESTRTLIIGLGQLGCQLINDVDKHSVEKFDLVCALDDDKSKKKVADTFGFIDFGSTNELETKVEELKIDYVILAITNASARF
ncbi:MAG TPA: hypothetical protein DF712_21285, partial [Balneola sp.]|nr:hypothetical protein [Balneola sp.]